MAYAIEYHQPRSAYVKEVFCLQTTVIEHIKADKDIEMQTTAREKI